MCFRFPPADNPALAAARPDTGDGEQESSKFKIILDLSAEVSDQADRIATLQKQVKERDREVERLKQITASTSSSQTLKSEFGRMDSSQRAQDDSGNTVKKGVAAHEKFSSEDSSKVQKSRNATFSRTGAVGPRSNYFTPVESTGNYNKAVRSRQQGPRPVPVPNTGPRNGKTPAIAGELSLQRQSTALSDSDSDWDVMDTPTSKIHSAPARMRVKSAAAVTKDVGWEDKDVDDRWSLATDDNHVMLGAEAEPARRGSSSGRQKKRSALKNKQERERGERAKCLMGPSLAFGAPSGEQLTDTSCNNTPSATPRTSDAGFGFSSSDVMSFAV